MIINEEAFDEVAIRVISSSKDVLPFKVIVRSPYEGKLDYAQVFELASKDKEIGAFVITNNPPVSTNDLVGYTEDQHEGLKNFTDDQLQILVNWASQRNSLCPAGTNWQMLQYECIVNRKSANI